MSIRANSVNGLSLNDRVKSAERKLAELGNRPKKEEVDKVVKIFENLQPSNRIRVLGNLRNRITKGLKEAKEIQESFGKGKLPAQPEVSQETETRTSSAPLRTPGEEAKVTVSEKETQTNAKIPTTPLTTPGGENEKMVPMTSDDDEVSPISLNTPVKTTVKIELVGLFMMIQNAMQSKEKFKALEDHLKNVLHVGVPDYKALEKENDDLTTILDDLAGELAKIILLVHEREPESYKDSLIFKYAQEFLEKARS